MSTEEPIPGLKIELIDLPPAALSPNWPTEARTPDSLRKASRVALLPSETLIDFWLFNL